MQYEIHPRRFWKRKEGFSNCPATVSIHGALPQPREAYEMAEKGFTIYDRKNNTFSNYFFGKIGIETKEQAEKIIEKLLEIQASYRKVSA